MYFDYGTRGRDESGEPYHRELGRLLREKGWQNDKSSESFVSKAGAMTNSPGGKDSATLCDSLRGN